ncbi:hypothetical protein CI102_5533, partial [Trichoderma harzianum]
LDFGTDNCFLIHTAPCLYCTFGLVDGDPRYLCRVDSFADNGCCVECNLARKRCTRIGFKPLTDETVNLMMRRKGACVLFQSEGRTEKTKAMLDLMVCDAIAYMVDMW